LGGGPSTGDDQLFGADVFVKAVTRGNAAQAQA
jgi:hypothetical protein